MLGHFTVCKVTPNAGIGMHVVGFIGREADKWSLLTHAVPVTSVRTPTMHPECWRNVSSSANILYGHSPGPVQP